MKIDAKRHKLLGILSKQRSDLLLNKARYNAIGVPFENIIEALKCSEDELELITSELYNSEEIGYHNSKNIIGLYSKDNGATAFANKKYVRRIFERRKERIRFLVQTIIPILALIIAILSLSIKFNNLKLHSDEELQKLYKKLKEQDIILNKLALDSFEENKADTLKIKEKWKK